MYNTHFQGKCGHTRKKKKRFTCDHTCKACVIQSYLFWIIYNVNNMYTQKKKKCCSLRSPAAPRGARLPLISPWSMASWWKKPCNFPVDFVYYRDKRYFELILIQSIKKVNFSANIGRCDHTCRVDVILFNSFWFICNVCDHSYKAVNVTHCKVH